MLKQRRDQIFKDEIEVRIERENVNSLNFNELFTDDLPQEAVELKEYDESR